MKNNTRELLAEYAHKAWCKWMTYVFKVSEIQSDGSRVIPQKYVNRWSRQISTKYSDLPEKEKESDRDQADEISNTIMTDEYGILKNIMEIKEDTVNGRPSYTRYTKICQTGDLNICDYGTGFVEIVSRAIPTNYSKWMVRLSVLTIDDSSLGGWSQAMSEEEADKLAHDIIYEVFSDIVKLPCLEELNKLLQKFDMYICDE